MYNGIGLVTPRGSGTNGYVVRNLSHLRTHDNSQRSGQGFDSAPPKHREPDQAILDHEKKRKVEVKCFELRVELEDKELPEAEIEAQVDALRKRLLENLASMATPAKHLKTSDTHGLLAAKKSELDKMAKALGTRSNYVEGDAFNREKQEQLRVQRAQEREANDKLREETRRKRDAEREESDRQRKERDRLRRREEDRVRQERAKGGAGMPPPPTPSSHRPPSPGPRHRDSRDRDYRRSPPRRGGRSMSRSRSPPPRRARSPYSRHSLSRSPPPPRRHSPGGVRRPSAPPARRPVSARSSRSRSRSRSASPPRNRRSASPKPAAKQSGKRSPSVSSGSAMDESD